MQGRLFFPTLHAGKCARPRPPQKAIKESSRWSLDILVADLDKVSMALTLLWVLGRGLAGHVRAGLTAVILPRSFGHTAGGV